MEEYSKKATKLLDNLLDKVQHHAYKVDDEVLMSLLDEPINELVKLKIKYGVK